ncbi:MAG: hypothetical protein E3K37_03980 [Candidatus Kuenenia sp.]|nr:hypothetical protein [Candidatus Kuenenia hertensis]
MKTKLDGWYKFIIVVSFLWAIFVVYMSTRYGAPSASAAFIVLFFPIGCIFGLTWVIRWIVKGFKK